MPNCKRNEIAVKSHCKAKPGKLDTKMGKRCDELNKSGCTSNLYKNSCTWVPSYCAEDQGKPGKTPTSERWTRKIKGGINKGRFSQFFPDNKVKWTKDACKTAGKKMKNKDVSLRSAIAMAGFPARMGSVPNSKSEACQDGIRSAYGK